MKKNVLIIGAGGVAHVAAHKAAMQNDVLGDICIASRTLSKCEAIIDSVQRKGHLKDPSKQAPRPPARRTRRRRHRGVDPRDRVGDRGQPRLGVRQHVGARRVPGDRCRLHRHGDPRGSRQGLRGPAVVRQPRMEEGRRPVPTRASRRSSVRGSIPGVVNAYAALAAKSYFDTIDTIDILDVNAGSHGRYFATNFDPEINFREFVKVWTWIDRQWQEFPTHAVKRTFEFPVVGEQPIYLNGHDELHSLSKHIDANSIRFWMGFGDHYINVFTVLRTLGLLSHEPVDTGRRRRGRPAPGGQGRASRPAEPRRRLHGQDVHRRRRQGHQGRQAPRDVHLPGERSRRRRTRRWSRRASATPPASRRSRRRCWSPRAPGTHGGWSTSKNSTPNRSSPCSTGPGLPTEYLEIEPGSDRSFQGEVGAIGDEIARSTATVTVSAADPMIALRGV